MAWDNKKILMRIVVGGMLWNMVNVTQGTVADVPGESTIDRMRQIPTFQRRADCRRAIDRGDAKWVMTNPSRELDRMGIYPLIA
jgi:hypothetical protein